MSLYKLKSGRWLNLAQATVIEDKSDSISVFFANRDRPEIISDHTDAQAVRVYLEKNEFHPTAKARENR